MSVGFPMAHHFEGSTTFDYRRGHGVESAYDGHARAPLGDFVHERFERRTILAPDAVALRFRGETVSYADLNRRANRLAHELATRGVGAGTRVAVGLEPGADIAVALLGILKAGAAYVPLDPSYPPARIRTILEDTEPAAAVTEPELVAKLGLGTERSILLGALSPTLPAENPRRIVRPEQPAAIFYTSGTTGKPKGVMLSHANLRHYVEVAADRYEFGPRDVMPAIARYAFSISLFELLSPLVAGGTSMLLEREHVLDPARLARSLAHVTVFHAGPSLLKGLLAYIRRTYPTFDAFAGVRHASSGGDFVPPELLEGLKEVFWNAEIFVIYGSSEISCMGCTYAVPRQRRVSTTYVGRPFDNVSVRVLDGEDAVVPTGVVGEIHFAGEGISLGYLERPELTAERYVVREGRRFYRMGDRGRMTPEGLLEVLGRADFQTKIRGMRVELGEVEYELRRAPGVREGVVVARGLSDGEKQLVAYVVHEDKSAGASDAKPVRLAAIRAHLAERLPDYMVPAVYVELERLPLNENLKIDRRALPEPDEADLRALSAQRRVREPETPTERTLASIWQGLLKIRQLSLDDNFFELGGHSLLAMQLSVEVERALGIRLEGMDVLRESLEVLACLCDETLGRSRLAPSERLRTPVVLDRPEIFHFGPEKSLYGVLHASGHTSDSAVVVAAPLGQENVRARFVLTRLARELARAGTPVLLFDYFGCGDSLGASSDAALARWESDIAAADHELRSRTGARRVAGLGVRLGGLLLCRAALGLELGRIVLWDPVHDGAVYHRSLVRMQRAYLRSVAPLRFWALRGSEPPPCELLGTSYSAAALAELEALTLPPLLSASRAEIRWLATSGPECEAALASSVRAKIARLSVECLDYDCGWCDVRELEDVLPDVGISRALGAMLKERA
jgi:amino acid adenylation domain-containing protein